MPYGLSLEHLMMRGYIVTLRGREIDTVYYDATGQSNAESVRRDLVEHDGYDPAIVVRRAGP